MVDRCGGIIRLMGKERSDLDSRFDNTERKFEEKSATSGTYWVFEPVSRTLFGPGTEDEMYNVGLSKFPGNDFIVRDLHTITKSEASSRIKGKQFSDPDIPFKEAIKRLKHK